MTSVADTVLPDRRRRTRTGVVVVLAVVLLVGLARVTLFETVTVSSDSMAPTVCAGGVVLVARWKVRDVGSNDIITFASPPNGTPSLKRVVGVAGQTVAIEDAQLVVDGAVVPEPYVDLDTIDGVYYGPVTVPAGTVLVMGDHREVSVDSRAYGPVPLGDIDGRSLATLWSSCPG